MAEQFYTILTSIGKAKLANSTALGTKLNLAKLKVGDSNGAYYDPTENQLDLRHPVWEGNINSISIDAENSNWIVLETIIPSNDGGFTIREAGVFDVEGNLIAIGKYPESYKPVLAEGSAKDLIIKMILEVSNTASVVLKIDPSVTLATKKDIEILDNKIKNINIPVTSVNNRTGAVNLKAADIKCADEKSIEEKFNTKADKTLIIEKTPTSAPEIYPEGMSVFYSTNEVWSINMGLDSTDKEYWVTTNKNNVNHATQEVVVYKSNTRNVLGIYNRCAYNNVWGTWIHVLDNNAINELLILMQGFTARKTVFNSDGSITETGDIGTKLTTFNADGTITEKFTDKNSKSISKKTTFNSDGSITEVVF